MRELLDRRRQILSKTIPRDELKELKQLVGRKVDYGNRLLSMDLVARDDDGVPVNPKTTGVMKLYKMMKQSQPQHSSEAGNRASIIQLANTTIPRREELHLFLKFSALALPVNEPCELFFFIYDASMSKMISERYMIALSQHCLPRDPEKINQCFAVYTDLDTSDLHNKQLYLACQVIRVGNDLEGKKTPVPLHKSLGAAVHPIHEILNTKPSDQEQWDVQMQVYTCPPSEYHKLLDSIIKKQGVYHPTEKGTGVFISLKPLRGSLDKVKDENPLLFRKFTAECLKMGFPEIIRPYDVRHDVYLTIYSGMFNKGTKRADKNVEVDIEVIDEKDNVIPNCICPGIGEPSVSLYRSLVQYHNANPVFNETVKLAIPPEMMRTARVRFYVYHKSTIISSKLGRIEPFAVAHLKLMKEDDTTIQDGEHELFVYKFKETSRGPNKYTALPCIHEPNTPHNVPSDVLCTKDTFSIRTQICSTKLTQNADLHRLLHWRATKEEKLPSILTAVTKVPGEEIVKFLADTFNALFDIMAKNADTVGDLVFEALVFIISLLAAEKYKNFRPVLDTYCDKLFNAATVHTHLVAKMRRVFEQVMLVDGTRRMRGDIIQKTLKAAEFLFKFIMKSRSLYEQGTRGKNSEQFLQSLRDLLRVICAMMKLECPENELIAPLAQAQALQFFPQTFDLILRVMSVVSLGEIVAELLHNLRETKLKIYKSVFMSSVVSSELFKHKESRMVVLPSILRHLQYHIQSRDDLLEKCLDSLGAILILLHDQEPSLVDEEVSMIVQEMLQVLFNCFMNLTGRTERVTAMVGLCVSVLMSLLEQMTPSHYQMFRQTFNSAADLEEFILCTLNGFCELVALNLYPVDWTSLKLLQNYVILRTTSQLSQILVEDFLGPDHDPLFFNPTLWQNFFQLAVAFTCQSTLQLENLGEIKRNRILDSYGDMRIAMNTLMINKWRALGSYQSRYVPGMIGPFLKVSLVPHTTIRRTTIPIFFDMMENEFKFRKNFHIMETEMIDKLDVFISGGMGDTNYRSLLHHMLSERCKSNPQMEREGGINFIESLVELLRRLLDYRTVQQGDEYRDLHMHVMFNLLNFYKEMGREEIYIRYIYRLAELHKASGNWVEAGFTLLLHAQLLQWTPLMQKQEGPYPRQSSADRKEALYHDIIDYFDKGKLWECGIEQCKEIASQLETVTFDYEKLSDIHKTIARFYSNIMREIRAELEYFRVGFYGAGFPAFLKNKVFIFRGHQYEKLHDFNTRLAVQFPNAKFMTTLEVPGLDILESNEQYIQACWVDPMPERETMAKFEGKSVAEPIARFYRTNHVRRFMLKRPFHRGVKDKQNEYKTLHTECTVYTTTYRFPGILRWFEVIDTEVIVKNPVENGLEMVLENVQQLKTLINRIRSDSTQSTNPLTMKLNGTLDAAVNGGVSKFEVFFSQEFLEQNPKCKPLVPKLRLLMEELCKVLEDGVALHAKVRPESMKALHQRMEDLLEDYRARYGGNSGSRDYDPISFLPMDPGGGLPKVRRLSSSRRRNSERQPVRPPSIHEREEGADFTSRERAATQLPNVELYDEPPRLPTRHRNKAATTHGSPPTIPPHRVSQNGAMPPPPPARRMVSQTSLTMSGSDESPPPIIPPRSSSVRLHPHRNSGSSFGSHESLEGSPVTTPQTYSPVTPHRDLPDPPTPPLPTTHPPTTHPPTITQPAEEGGATVKQLIAKMGGGGHEEPPPLPRKVKSQSILVQHGGHPNNESTC